MSKKSPEALKMAAPTTGTRNAIEAEIGVTVTADSGTSGVERCPHCTSTAKHSDKIGCCSECKLLFTSMSAFDKHRRVTYCVHPETVGLVAKTLKQDPAIPAWGWPKSDVVWERG